MSLNSESLSLTNIFQRVNTWQDFANALPPGLVETFGGEEQFFLTLLLLNKNTPESTAITKDAFLKLIAVQRDKEKIYVPLPTDKAEQLWESSLKAGLIFPIPTKTTLGSYYTPNLLFKEAFIRFEKNEPKTD